MTYKVLLLKEVQIHDGDELVSDLTAVLWVVVLRLYSPENCGLCVKRLH